MANWTQVKAEFDQMITKSGVTNPEFIKIFMLVARRVNTCKNMLYVAGNSWEYVCNSKPYWEAVYALELINGNRYGESQANLNSDWKQFCNANRWCADCTVGDWLS